MRKLFIIPLLFLGMITWGQMGIKFEDTTFANLLAKSKKENKPIFLDAYTSWCGPCKLMAKQVFTLQTVGDFYNANFINAKMDMEKGEGIKIAKKFNIKSYPTYLIIDGNGELVTKKLGFTPENDFIQFGKNVLDPTKKLSVQKKKFDDGEKDPKFLQDLTSLALDNNNEDLATKALTRYFQVSTCP